LRLGSVVYRLSSVRQSLRRVQCSGKEGRTRNSEPGTRNSKSLYPAPCWDCWGCWTRACKKLVGRTFRVSGPLLVEHLSIIYSDHPVMRNSSVPRLLLGISIGVGVGDILDPPDSVGSSVSASASAVRDPLGRSRRWCWGVKGLVLRCGLAGFFVQAVYGGAVAVVAGHCLGVAL